MLLTECSRDTAGMVIRCLVLFVRGLMRFVDNNEANLAKRGKKCRARANDNERLFTGECLQPKLPPGGCREL